MGTFSWLKADNLTKVANIAEGKPFKFLIPKEFGGGFIKDVYQGYGHLGTKENGSEKYDMYELLAFWNKDLVEGELRYDGEFPKMKEADNYTRENRCLGIDIGCYDIQIDKLKYPLKLVSASYKGTYEDLNTRSYGDPDQGFYPVYRETNNSSTLEEDDEEEIMTEEPEKIKSVEDLLQELFSLLDKNNCGSDIIGKFLELSTSYCEEKKTIKTLHREIVSILK